MKNAKLDSQTVSSSAKMSMIQKHHIFSFFLRIGGKTLSRCGRKKRAEVESEMGQLSESTAVHSPIETHSEQR